MLAAEHANLRAALRWMVRSSKAELSERLASALEQLAASCDQFALNRAQGQTTALPVGGARFAPAAPRPGGAAATWIDLGYSRT